MPKYISLSAGMVLFLETIKDNLVHQDYPRVNAIAEDYTSYATAENIARKLVQFTPRESADLFAQRIRLTQVTTPDIVGGCMKPMFKVGRTPAIIHFKWKDEQKNEEYKKQLLSVAKNFFGETSVDEYLTYRMVELDTTDPNSFIVVEFTTDKEGKVDPKDPGSKAQPYPFEVNSKEAVNYIYKNNILQWLIVKNCIEIVDGKGKEIEGEKYLMYLDQNSISATQIHVDLVESYIAQNNPIIIKTLDPNMVLDKNKVYLYQTDEKAKTKRRSFIVRVFEHKIGFVPARRVGTMRDLITRGRTCVPLIHAAQPYLEKSIKTISEFDLTNCLHTFPQKIAYVDKCPGYTEEKEGSQYTVPCLRGINTMGHKCKECQGSGIKIHKTTADLIGVPMPKDPKDMVSLENMLVYKYPPTEILEFQKKLALYEWRYFATKAVWNSEVFDKEDVAVTATEKRIDLDAVYDTLKPFADNYSGMWKHIMKSIAILRDIGSDMEVIHEYPKDFKMKPYTELLNDYKLANENGAPSYIKKALTNDISMKLYVDQPQELVKINTKQKYYPFAGKTESEINYILANDLCTEYNKIFYANFDNVFTDIEYDVSKKTSENGPLDFYQMTEEEQRKLIEAKVQEYVDAIEEQDISQAAVAFNGAATNLGITPKIPGAVDKGNSTTLNDNNPDNTNNPDNVTA